MKCIHAFWFSVVHFGLKRKVADIIYMFGISTEDWIIWMKPVFLFGRSSLHELHAQSFELYLFLFFLYKHDPLLEVVNPNIIISRLCSLPGMYATELLKQSGLDY